MNTKLIIRQYISIIIVQVITVLLMALWMDGLQIKSPWGAIGILVVYTLSQAAFWWLFIRFFSYLPAWLYPILTFLLSTIILLFFGKFIPGIIIVNFRTGLYIILILSSVSTVQAGYLSLDLDIYFDRVISRQIVMRHGKPNVTEEPGILYLEIDGLSEKIFRRAMQEGYLPTLQSWYEKSTHHLISWETDFTSQTGSIQAGLLLGNNDDIPAYRWWDRNRKQAVRSGNFADSAALEQKLSNGQGLLSHGGASRGNMFSGDATESLFTISTLLNRSHVTGPGFYLFLINPFVVARLLTRFTIGVIKERRQALQQKLRRDNSRITSRNFFYAFTRSSECQVLQEITTHIVICDILRGLPSVYTVYAGYDDVAHYTGMESSESFETLTEIDRFIARIAHAASHAPRPYRIVVLSDHGQSDGGPFQNKYGISLEQLVKSAIRTDENVFSIPNNAETLDRINALINESIHADAPAINVLRTLLRSKENIMVEIGAEKKQSEYYLEQEEFKKAGIIVLASGSLGLVNFAQSDQRLYYEEIQYLYPDLLINLVSHPGIGFVLVRSSKDGDIVLGKDGMYFLDKDTFFGVNPLSIYSSHVPELLRRESNFSNCPDLIISSRYDPITDKICGFENQASHHGGIGGTQSFPFIFFPSDLPYSGKQLVGAIQVHQLLKNWRDYPGLIPNK